jgi:hypothetical protein
MFIMTGIGKGAFKDVFVLFYAQAVNDMTPFCPILSLGLGFLSTKVFQGV